jgi:hypothetical protein
METEIKIMCKREGVRIDTSIQMALRVENAHTDGLRVSGKTVAQVYGWSALPDRASSTSNIRLKRLSLLAFGKW